MVNKPSNERLKDIANYVETKNKNNDSSNSIDIDKNIINKEDIIDKGLIIKPFTKCYISGNGDDIFDKKIYSFIMFDKTKKKFILRDDNNNNEVETDFIELNDDDYKKINKEYTQYLADTAIGFTTKGGRKKKTKKSHKKGGTTKKRRHRRSKKTRKH